MGIFGINVKNQVMFGGIALAALSAGILFPDQLSGMLGTAVGDFEVPVIGMLTVEKIVALVGAVIGIDMLTK